VENETESISTGLMKSIRDFLTGLTGYEHSLFAMKEKAVLENIMMLIIFGDFLGVPIIKPYYALRMLPAFYPSLKGWKRSVLRERDWTDRIVD
jgi:hypothetical protein